MPTAMSSFFKSRIKGSKGKEDPIETTLAVIEKIRDTFGKESIVLYGGSVNPENSIVYLENELIDGALVGGASLAAEEFAQL